MKITKLIREYVEEQVAKVYDARKNPYAEQAEQDKQKIEAFEQELRDQQKEALDKFLAENELFENDWRGTRRKATMGTSTPCVSYYKTQAMLKSKEWQEENSRQKKAKTREIMLALELGANRKELDEMLAKLLEEG